MTKTRMEAFSDGVFAIVITLLILEVHVPEGVDAGHLGDELVRLLPTMGAYFLSFFVVGLYWMVHHRTMHLLKAVNQPILWINIIWLLFVSVMPFTTGLLGGYPLQPLPVAIYGLNLIFTNVTGVVSMIYTKHHPELTHEPLNAVFMRRLAPRYAIINGLYLVGVVLAWYWPAASYVIYTAVLVGLITGYWSDRPGTRTEEQHDGA
jgi:uncharacterized membrane protein